MIEIIEHGKQTEIKLSRPPVNALNPQLLQALLDALIEVEQSSCDGVVLSGGDKVFSAGLDVPFLSGLKREELGASWMLFFRVAQKLASLEKPIVAAINGHNPAGGCVLALCCDYRVMAEGDFKIGLNETQVGLVVPGPIQYLMVRCVGANKATQLMMHGAMVDSARAFKLGMVDELSAHGEVVNRALVFLEQLSSLPRTPMLKTRALARKDMVDTLNQFTQSSLGEFLDDWYGPDTQAALNALLQKLGKK